MGPAGASRMRCNRRVREEAAMDGELLEVADLLAACSGND